MGEVTCRLCHEGTTNEKDGICRICKLFRKEEVAELMAKDAAMEKIVRAGFKPAPTETKTDKTHGGVKMAERDYADHKKCSKEGCKKYAVKEGMCTRHFNEAHGIEKHYVRKAKAVSVDSVSDSKKKRGRPSKVVIPAPLPVIPVVSKRGSRSKGNGDCDGIILKLMNAKADYHRKIMEIENAIEVLERYA